VKLGELSEKYLELQKNQLVISGKNCELKVNQLSSLFIYSVYCVLDRLK